MAFEEHLKQLHDQLWFKRLVEEHLLPKAPTVPTYDPAKDNTERWKYDCALREGYFMALNELGVRHGGRK